MSEDGALLNSYMNFSLTVTKVWGDGNENIPVLRCGNLRLEPGF